MIHRAHREGYWPPGCQLVIVSTRYGLLLAETPIACYDLKMTRAQAVLLQPQVSSALDDLLLAMPYDALFLNLGAFYRLTVQESCELERLRLAGRVLEAQGGLGQRLQQTKRWLMEIGRSDAASLTQVSEGM